MDQYNSNINPQFMHQPEKPKGGKGKWIIIIAAIVIFLGLLVFGAIRLGMGFGKKVGTLANKTMVQQDSINEKANQETYDRIYALLGKDSASNILRAKLDSLNARTERLISTFNQYKAGFRDTLEITKAIPFDKSVSNRYFIKTGRAPRLKQTMLAYRKISVAEMGDTANAQTYEAMLMIDEVQKAMPGLLKKLLTWENMYFDQPPQTVMMNIGTIKTQIHNFESALLANYEMQVNMMPVQPLDSVQ